MPIYGDFLKSPFRWCKKPIETQRMVEKQKLWHTCPVFEQQFNDSAPGLTLICHIFGVHLFLCFLHLIVNRPKRYQPVCICLKRLLLLFQLGFCSPIRLPSATSFIKSCFSLRLLILVIFALIDRSSGGPCVWV